MCVSKRLKKLYFIPYFINIVGNKIIIIIIIIVINIIIIVIGGLTSVHIRSAIRLPWGSLLPWLRKWGGRLIVMTKMMKWWRWSWRWSWWWSWLSIIYDFFHSPLWIKSWKLAAGPIGQHAASSPPNDLIIITKIVWVNCINPSLPSCKWATPWCPHPSPRPLSTSPSVRGTPSGFLASSQGDFSWRGDHDINFH